MSMIQVENLSFSYPSSYDNIFENVNFSIDTDWKLGFIGRNGRGKTTFLQLLLGKYPYSGRIRSSVAFDYFPYPISDPSRLTADVLSEVCPFAAEWELLRELSLLDVEESVLYRPFSTLSNGEQTKVLLAALFLNGDRFLLIDEPTNHLDMEGRRKVAAYLNRKTGFILVSHDRRFLDGCVDHILSLNRANIEVQSGNYSSFMENFNRRQHFEQSENERLQKDICRLQVSAARTAGWSEHIESSKKGGHDKGYIGHKSAKMMQRAKAIEARQQRAIEEKSGLLKNVEKAESLKLFPADYPKERLAVFDRVEIRYDDRTVTRPISFTVERGERIALEGKNGCGKSSLLKLLLGQSIEHTGLLSVGTGLVISYVPQDTSHLHGKVSEFAKRSGINETQFLTILRKLDFERIQFEKDLSELSGGQKKKVLIAKSLCERAHLYIWDEPLNFIDLYSRIQIEELLARFLPTMLFVEHDAAFRDTVATRTVRL